ncbi:MAG: hydroxylamine oxidase [Desulfosarcina sp.]|nr:hydroxylamine oxidase [Desulfobacterales bacterium]
MLFGSVAAFGQDVSVSDATQECLDCHAVFHPGIVEGWKTSRHAAITPAVARQADDLALKVSSKDIPEGLQKVAVGCAECHGLRPMAHADSFEHNGYEIHVVVSPDDCRTCHATEADQYSRNIMAHAVNNLADNKVYNQLEKSILAARTLEKGPLKMTPADDDTRAEACYYCHGTVLKVSGTEMRDTDAGELEFPVIEGWPNQGVGPINLDGSKGACSACHTRHTFSMAMARQPYTCKECHVGPDVPAYKVYLSSKHGNIYSSKKQEWDFKAVPWTVGRDFKAPTCAACHISLLVNTDDEVINPRTHEMKDRLSWRIFGLIYAHPQPRSPDTSIIRNRDGLSLPTDFKGGLAESYLIGPEERAARPQTMQAPCRACHDTSWVEGYWRRYRKTIARSNEAVRTVTEIMTEGWARGYAQGLDQGANPFDERSERMWSDTWLFYANTVRFASAMAGGGDFGVFADGQYQLSRATIDLHAWLEGSKALESLKAGKP